MTLATVVVGSTCWFTVGYIVAWIVYRSLRGQALQAKRWRRSLHRYLRHRHAALNPPRDQARYRTLDQVTVDEFLKSL